MHFEEDANAPDRRGIGLDWIAWRFCQLMHRVFGLCEHALIRHRALYDEWRRGKQCARVETPYVDRETGSTVFLRRACFGEKFAEKRFLLIRRDNCTAGLFSHYIVNVSWIRFAIKNDFVPVVDMQYANNIYTNGKTNVWDLCFDQPTEYTLSDVLKARNVYIAEKDPPSAMRPNAAMPFLTRDCALWRYFITKDVRLKRALSKLVDKAWRELTEDGKSTVLGVLLRGTDYVSLRPPSHPVMPTWRQVADDVRRYRAKTHVDKIFLVTEDAEIAEGFQREFADVVLAQKPLQYSGKGFLCQSRQVSKNFDLAKTYLLNIVLLSKCKYVIAARTSGTVGAVLMAEDSKNWMFYDLGSY